MTVSGIQNYFQSIAVPTRQSAETFNVGLIHNLFLQCIICFDWQALAEAIQSVTEMNQDLAVEKIEIETATDLEVNGPK